MSSTTEPDQPTAADTPVVTEAAPSPAGGTDELARLRAEVAELTAQKEDMLAGYSAALDEIWALRKLCAYEAGAMRAHLHYRTFPKSRRGCAEDSIERLQAAARGGTQVAVAPLSHLSLRHALREAGAEDGLTRVSWERSLPTRSGRQPRSA